MNHTGKMAIVLIALLLVVMYIVSGQKPAMEHKEGASAEKETGMEMGHMAKIENDQDFLNEMIPHHEEAVETSRIIASTTQDPEVMKFAENVINAQTAEIEQMKGWYSTWFNTEYQDNEKYEAMMPDLTKSSGEEQKNAYIKGMIEHHKGAIQMAKQILPITTREEVKQLANSIIENQSKEVTQLESWMGQKHE